jgi:hypothetical protein
VFLLPFIDLERGEFEVENDYGGFVWTPEAMQFGSRFLEQLIWLHKNSRQQSTKTPTPDWSKEAAFLMLKEVELGKGIAKINLEIDVLVEQRQNAEEALQKQSKLRDLLFENGSMLEDSLHLALGILGFKTSRYHDTDSEFDVVFESEEGRLLGEAEGKDTKPINIGKLRQLQMNILEDLEREEVELPAKAVLLGNGFRLAEPSERPEQFTTKCQTASQQNGTALISTVELFYAAKYLAENENDAFSQKCRETILNGVGIVALPAPPEM